MPGRSPVGDRLAGPQAAQDAGAVAERRECGRRECGRRDAVGVPTPHRRAPEPHQEPAATQYQPPNRTVRFLIPITLGCPLRPFGGS